MDVKDLVDLSAARALAHASTLQEHLRGKWDRDAANLDECRAEMHELVADIVSLRNAAELLMRELDAAS